MTVEAAGLKMKQALMQNNNSTLPGLMFQFLHCSEDNKEKSCKKERKSLH